MDFSIIYSYFFLNSRNLITTQPFKWKIRTWLPLPAGSLSMQHALLIFKKNRMRYEIWRMLLIVRKFESSGRIFDKQTVHIPRVNWLCLIGCNVNKCESWWKLKRLSTLGLAWDCIYIYSNVDKINGFTFGFSVCHTNTASITGLPQDLRAPN